MTEVNRMEAVAQMRVQQWEEAVQQRKLLAEIAPPPTLWNGGWADQSRGSGTGSSILETTSPSERVHSVLPLLASNRDVKQ